ncbi:MAG: HU family DNA-binding protein [Candidatus Marinimicrobia bacterium]|nr:HU family DNA-binding protein [Candidatus Neomarinimicrobiota bacterium]
MSIKITFQQLVDEFSISTGRTKAFTKEFIKDVFTTIQEGLRRDENVNIKGLGIFKLQEVAERETVNPKTGKVSLIEAHKKVVFKPEKALREKVNAKYAKLKTKNIKMKEAPKPAPVITPIVEKPVKKEQLTFGEPLPKAPVKKTTPPPPPPPPKNDNKKIMPTFIIEEKKKKSAWRWLLPLLLLILIFVVIFIVPTKFDSMEDLAFWRNWNWGKDSIPDHPTVIETTEVETEIMPINQAENIFVQAPLPNKESVPVEKLEPILEKKEQDSAPVKQEEPVEPTQSVEMEDEQTLIHIVKPGNTLWGLSKHYYSRTSLWPNIYRKNVEILRTPDLLHIGRELLIPQLQGDSFELTKSDSARIAQGYYLAYRAYKKYDAEKAEGYLKVAKKFSTTLDK